MSTDTPRVSPAESPTPTARKARLFGGGWQPQVGHICLLDLEGAPRPFLPVTILSDTAIRGWAFVDPGQDQHTTFLRNRGFSADARRLPCYCEVARTALSPLPRGG